MKTRMTHIVVFGLAFLMVGCAAKQKPFDYTKEPDPRNKPYLLGVSDHIRITVWQNADLSTEAVIRPDGTITIALLGDIKAAGLTPNQLKIKIKKRLENYIRSSNPTVTVSVMAVNSYRFTISGNVFNGGSFTPGKYVTIMEAIAMSGGLNRFADPEGIIINRTDSTGRVRRIPVNYDAIASGKSPQQNLVILPGDTVFVP